MSNETARCYSFHPRTGEYLGEGLCDRSPLQSDVWLIPGHATLSPPPTVESGQVAVFLDDAWRVETDRRGETWYRADGYGVVIAEIGDPSALGLSPEKPEIPPGSYHVQRERERRLAAGFDYNFGDARGVHRIGTTPADLAGWDEVSKLASAMIAIGETGADINIVTDTGACAVTAMEWQGVLIAAAGFRQPIWGASFALQAMSPIPADYADDSRWSA